MPQTIAPDPLMAHAQAGAIRGQWLAVAEDLAYTPLIGESLGELGRVIALLMGGNFAVLKSQLLEERAEGGLSPLRHLDLEEIRSLSILLRTRTGAAMSSGPSADWRDMAQAYSSTDFLSRSEETKRRGRFEFSPEAKAFWEKAIQADPEKRAIYQRLDDAMRLASSMLGMIEEDHFALAFALKFFGDTQEEFGESSEDRGYLGMGRVLLAMSSGDVWAIEEAFGELNIGDVNEMYRSFDKEISKWRSENEVRPIEDQAARDFLDGLDVTTKAKREAAGITDDMTLAEQQRRLSELTARHRASAASSQRA